MSDTPFRANAACADLAEVMRDRFGPDHVDTIACTDEHDGYVWSKAITHGFREVIRWRPDRGGVIVDVEVHLPGAGHTRHDVADQLERLARLIRGDDPCST